MTSIIWWNYLLAALDVVGLVALIAVGRKKAVGWLWAMVTQAVWIVYSTATLQWGFLAVAVIKLAIYSWNWVKWMRGATKTIEGLAAEIVDAQYPAAPDDLRRQFTEDILASLHRDGFYDKPPKRVSV
ncbi:hypothetical protein [Streptomyces sp. NPDC059761]|uniref:hypothetical protein n=1 Tax=Streptomyces sp. NPDC059761 TaxID=3346937 RepID=UPI0036670C73